MSTILGKSLLRLVKGAVGGWLLVIVILPYGLMSETPTTGAVLSGGLLVALVGVLIWDYRKGAAKIYPLLLDGLILFGVAGLSGAVLGALGAVFGYKFSYPWWIAPLVGLICFALLEMRNVSAVAKVNEDKHLAGLGGWLILVGIGVVMTPLWIGTLLFRTYPPIFSDGTWEGLTTPGHEAYNPLWAPILLSEIVINIGMIFVSVYLVYLYFWKRRAFPKWYIGIAVVSLLFIVIDARVIKLVMPEEPVLDPDTVKELSRSLVANIIWVPYMLVSRRVKATFVK